jgi:hypothetical protein
VTVDCRLTALFVKHRRFTHVLNLAVRSFKILTYERAYKCQPAMTGSALMSSQAETQIFPLFLTTLHRSPVKQHPWSEIL